jgi:hypothetical protein
MFDPPGNHFPSVPGFQDFPFSAVSPIFLLPQRLERRSDLLPIPPLRVFGMFQAANLAAASGQQRETHNEEQTSPHYGYIGKTLLPLKERRLFLTAIGSRFRVAAACVK